MVQYRYAFNELGVTVSAEELAGKPVTGTYSCLGCGGALIPKVNGEIHRPHFAHKVYVECSGETYLHRLGKTVFEETYRECIRKETPFYIRLTAARECKKYRPGIIENCNLGFVEKEFDLTRYFSDVIVEKKDGNFIPDLKLCSRKNPDQSIYIEIAVSNFLSEAKERSGNRIIQIPLEEEADVEKIRRAYLTNSDALFVGFIQPTVSISDSECECAKMPYYGFFVFETGKAFLDYGPLMVVHSRIIAQKEKVTYTNVFSAPKQAKADLTDHGEERGALFRDQLALAVTRGVKVKNCFLCRYHGSNWDATNEAAIYCKTYRKACGSNEAASCDRFRSSSL